MVESRGCSIVPICLHLLYYRTPKRVFDPVDFGEVKSNGELFIVFGVEIETKAITDRSHAGIRY